MRRFLCLVLAALGAMLGACEKTELSAPAMSPDILSIAHMEFGLEEFPVEDARYNLCQDEKGIWEFVVKVSCGEAVKRSKELAGLTDGRPGFEATAVLPTVGVKLVAGTVISQKAGYDYERSPSD